MKPRQFTLLSATFLAAIAAAFLYLANDPTSDFDERIAETSGDADQAAKRSSIVRADGPEAEKPKPQIEKVDPLDYTTAPKPDTMEGKIVRLFADRKLPDLEKVERMLAMVPQLPPQGKAMAMDHATKLIPDEDYLRLRPRLLRLADSDELQEVVMLDALTRDDTIKMPTLVEMLKLSSATTRSEAREILEAYLDQDYGDDARQWDAPVRQWLADNAEI